jgi:hypothetical protein
VSGTTTELRPGRPGATTQVEARNWIERQLHWERTLGSLRDQRTEHAQRAA